MFILNSFFILKLLIFPPYVRFPYQNRFTSATCYSFLILAVFLQMLVKFIHFIYESKVRTCQGAFVSFGGLCHTSAHVLSSRYSLKDCGLMYKYYILR